MGESKEFPRWKHHFTGKTTLVKSQEEVVALGGGWAESPAELAPYQGPRRAGPQYVPDKWVNQWSLEGLSADCRKRVAAQLFKAHGSFWKSPDALNAETNAMRLAYDLVAGVLFNERLLSAQVLSKDLPEFVWDTACAGGWWRLSSETLNPILPEKLGHYWVWRDESRDWDTLWTAEAAEWHARLLERSVPVLNTENASKVSPRRAVGRTPPASARTGAQSWMEIQIEFISEERVQIWFQGEPTTVNYEEMGFCDRRNGRPNRCWSLLRLLAQHQGTIPVAGRRSTDWPAIEKRVQQIRKLLQSHFGISQDPLPFEKRVGYQLRCQIKFGSSFDK
jgi:hypothetical protein